VLDNVEQSAALEIQRSFAIDRVSPHCAGARGQVRVRSAGVGRRWGSVCGVVVLSAGPPPNTRYTRRRKQGEITRRNVVGGPRWVLPQNGVRRG